MTLQRRLVKTHVTEDRDPVDTVQPAATRAPLSRARILEAAVVAADEGGLEGLSMRRLGQALGVDPMALYRHVRDKDDLLDGLRDVVLDEIPVVEPEPDWRAAMRRLTLGAREVMRRHPWAPRLLEDRAQGPSIIAYVDVVLGIFHAGGLSTALAHHALHVLGSRVVGFTQDLFEDAGDPEADPEAAAAFARSIATIHPHVARLAVAVSHEGGLGGCDSDEEFLFGLDLLLDGLERLREADPA
jgi:AcrR family transcriptional regulator